MIVRCANIHKQKREGRWKMYHFLPFPSYFPCQVKNSIHFNPEIFKQPTFNPPQKLPNRAQDMRHWTFNCYSDPSTIINSDQMIKSLRPWLPCNMCRSIICYPLIKLGNSTKIQKAWFPNPNPPVYPNVQIPRFTVHMSPKKKTIRDAKETPSEQQRSETSNPRITCKKSTEPTEKGAAFFVEPCPPPISLAINTVSIGCQCSCQQFHQVSRPNCPNCPNCIC